MTDRCLCWGLDCACGGGCAVRPVMELRHYGDKGDGFGLCRMCAPHYLNDPAYDLVDAKEEVFCP